MTKKILTAFIALGLIFTAVSCSDDGGNESTDRITFTYDEYTNRYTGTSTIVAGGEFYVRLNDDDDNSWEFGSTSDSNSTGDEHLLVTGNYEPLSDSTVKLNIEKIQDNTLNGSFDMIDHPKDGWKTVTLNDEGNSFTITLTESEWFEIFPGLNDL